MHCLAYLIPCWRVIFNEKAKFLQENEKLRLKNQPDDMKASFLSYFYLKLINCFYVSDVRIKIENISALSRIKSAYLKF